MVETTNSMAMQVMSDDADSSRRLATITCSYTDGKHLGITLVLSSEYNQEADEELVGQALRDCLEQIWQRCRDFHLPLPAGRK